MVGFQPPILPWALSLFQAVVTYYQDSRIIVFSPLFSSSHILPAELLDFCQDSPSSPGFPWPLPLDVPAHTKSLGDSPKNALSQAPFQRESIQYMQGQTGAIKLLRLWCTGPEAEAKFRSLSARIWGLWEVSQPTWPYSNAQAAATCLPSIPLFLLLFSPRVSSPFSLSVQILPIFKFLLKF